MQKNIVAIDDEPGMVKLVADKLSQSGYSVRTASGGDEGLKLIYASIPDLIICDLQMPGIDGLEVSRRLKTDPRYKKIPMIMLSGLVGEDSEAEGLQRGDFYMSKPFNLERLVAKIKELLNEDGAAAS